MSRLAAVAQLALCFVFIFCNSGNGQTRPSSLVGRWVYISGTNMELFKDGTGIHAGSSISWKVDNNRFIILNEYGGNAYDYKVSGYQLILSRDDGGVDTIVRKEKYAEFKAKRDADIEAEKEKQVAAAKAREEERIAEAKKVAETAKATISTFTDKRDNKVYRKVTIGGKIWMVENLNFAADGSKCFGEGNALSGFEDAKTGKYVKKVLSATEVQENCDKYGRLYDWTTAKQACPAGFHLPDDDEWTALTDAVGGAGIAGTKLKSMEGWGVDRITGVDGRGTDDFGFSALPGGVWIKSSYTFGLIGKDGYWWSASKSRPDWKAWFRQMYFGAHVNRGDGSNEDMCSVRCVQD